MKVHEEEQPGLQPTLRLRRATLESCQDGSRLCMNYNSHLPLLNINDRRSLFGIKLLHREATIKTEAGCDVICL